MANKTIVIIGSGIAGLTAAEWARKTDPDVEIIMLSENPHFPYHRPRLPGVIMDPESADRITLRDEAWYDSNNIDLRRGVVVRHVDIKKKTLELDTGDKLKWNKLILATGSRSFMPPMEGNNLEGVFTLWTLDSALQISDYIKGAKNAVVIGGGLLGLEMAYALKQRGLHTTILERGTRLLSRQLDERASAMFEEQVDRVGVHVKKEAVTDKMLAHPDTNKVRAVLLDDGTEVPADIVVVATGVRARLELFDGQDIAIDRCFVTNNKMETSLPDVYAAGDCALMDGLWYGLWSVAMREGKVAGINAAGGDEICTIPAPPYLVNTMETRIASAGDIAPKDPEISSRIHFDETQLTYDRRNFLGESLVGYILLGDTTPFSMLSRELQES